MSIRGNVLFILLICIVGFAALVYAVSASNTGTGKDASDERAELAQAQTDNCSAQVENAIIRLQTVGGCEDDEISYELPGGQNANPDAPADKHCHLFHPSGAGASPCGSYSEFCDMTALAIGETDCGVVYAGSHASKRLYVTPTGEGAGEWHTTGFVVLGGASSDDGQANTDAILTAAPGWQAPAAKTCRVIGEDWYLPSINELGVIIGNESVGDLAGTFPDAEYWSSTEHSVNPNRTLTRLADNTQSHRPKNTIGIGIRCVRSD